MSRKVIHLIAQAHLDPVWLWRWDEGYSEVLTTMQSASDRLKETKGLRFSRSSAMAYRWVEDSDPRLFAEIAKHIQSGNWEVVNGWIVQPDCNIPSTESFVRHCLCGKNYFSSKFNYDVKVGYNVDSFGHSGGLPQILSRAGYKYYVFMRPSPRECELPNLFWWRSLDGSRVLTWKIPKAYCQAYHCKPEELEDLLISVANDGFLPGFNHTAFFLGVGNHGGGPTKRQLEKITELQKKGFSDGIELRYSTLQEFFAEIEKSPNFDKIPVIDKELQHHATGCYSSVGEIKSLNRKAEKLMFHAESASLLTELKSFADYPKDDFENAWWKILFNQFHDILSGSSLKKCYSDATETLGAACDSARQIAVRSAHTMARRVNTENASGGVLFVMNTLPWPRKSLVQFDYFTSPDGEKMITHLETDTGAAIPLQWNSADASFGPHGKEWKKLTAMIDLPPFGYRTLSMACNGSKDKSPKKHTGLAAISSKTPGLSSLKATDGRELLAGPVSLIAIKDTSDAWGHDMYEYREALGHPELLSTDIVADGPVMRTYRQRAKWQDSEIILDITTFAELDIIELHIRVNWQQKHQMLKLEIPTNLTDVSTCAKIAGGVIKREANGTEEPGQDWIAVEGMAGDERYSLGLINNSTYSYDCKDGLLRSVIARAAVFAEHVPFEIPPLHLKEYMDQGWCEKKFWILSCKGNYHNMNLSKVSSEMQIPAEYVIDSAHPGTEPWENSLLELESNSIEVLSVKKALRGDDYIIRIQEMAGKDSEAQINIPILGVKHKSTLNPYEIKTLKISSGKPAEICEVNLLEHKI